METFRRKQREMGDQIKEMTGLAIGGEKAMLGYIGKFSALGLAASAGVTAMKSFASQIADLNRLGRDIGVPTANIINMVEQLKKAGASTEEATTFVKGLTGAMQEFGRRGSREYQELLQHAGSYSAAMQKLVQDMERAQSIEEKGRLLQEAVANARRNATNAAIEHGKTQAEADIAGAKAAENLAERFHTNIDTLNRMTEAFQNMTGEQKAAFDAQIKQGEEVHKMWNEMSTSIEAAGRSLTLSFGPMLVKTFEDTVREGKAVIGVLDEIQKKLGIGGQDQKPGEGGEANRPDVAISRWLLEHMPGRGKSPGELLGVPHMQHGGIVNKATLAMIGEGGPEAVVPLDQLGGGGKQGDKSRLLDDNTKELKELNDNLFALLHPTGAGAPGGGLGGIHGGAGGGGGGAGGGGGGTGGGGGGTGGGGGGGGTDSTGSDGKTGAAPVTPEAQAAAAGSKFFDPFTGKVASSGVLGDPNASPFAKGKGGGGLGGLGSHGVLGAEGLGGTGGGGGGGAGGGGKFADTGELKGTGAHGTLNPDALYKTLYNNVPDNLIGHVPKDGAKFGITTGSRQEWAKLQFKLAMQEFVRSNKSIC